MAEGRLHLTAVVLLSPHLREDTAAELIAAATHKTASEIERLLAERFPRPDVLAWVAGTPAASGARSEESHAPVHVEDPEGLPFEQAVRPVENPGDSSAEQAVRPVPAPLSGVPVGDRPRVKPRSSESFAVQFTLSRSGHDRLRYVQELLSHQIPSGDIAAVFEKTMEIAVAQLEKRKFAATGMPRNRPRSSTPDSRHIPAPVQRAVWARDGGRCTFVSETGHRCEARELIEYDHIEAFARGGEATVAGNRLRCRSHNQYAAERTFGAEFMRHKRVAAAEARARA